MTGSHKESHNGADRTNEVLYFSGELGDKMERAVRSTGRALIGAAKKNAYSLDRI